MPMVTMYTKELMPMREKKTEVMTIRVTSKTKSTIEREAEKREWTPSKMAEKVLSTWAEQQPQPENEEK